MARIYGAGARWDGSLPQHFLPNRPPEQHVPRKDARPEKADRMGERKKVK